MVTLRYFASVPILAICALGCTSTRATEPAINSSPSAKPTETTLEIEEFRETYTVVRGDTLIAIAHHFGIHLNDLVSENFIADPTKIYVGQVLLIPSPPSEEDGPLLTIAPPTDPLLPTLEPTTTLAQ